MTQREIDEKISNWRNIISDKFKDMQMQSQALKNPEDETKNNIILTKISDDIADIRRAFGEVKVLGNTIPDEEEDDGYDNGFSFEQSFI